MQLTLFLQGPETKEERRQRREEKKKRRTEKQERKEQRLKEREASVGSLPRDSSSKRLHKHRFVFATIWLALIVTITLY